MKRCLVNGLEKNTVAVQDRGLNYADGLFETVAVINGKPRNWQLHMLRLAKGCNTLGIPAPDPESLYDDLARVTVDIPRAVVKIVITRGGGGRGYRYEPGNITPTRIVSSHDWPV